MADYFLIQVGFFLEPIYVVIQKSEEAIPPKVMKNRQLKYSAPSRAIYKPNLHKQ